jgi:RHS repeat-associated protein
MVYDVFGQQIADYNGSTVERENIYRGRQLLAVQQASGELSYVLTDAQGSTRALMNNSGSGTSTITSRRDYLSFGEEIGAGVGLRTTTQKYSQSDSVRRRFAMMERDDVSGLDHTWFRKFESRAGRWTSPDPYIGSQTVGNPQSMNRYSYVGNDPVNFVDPSGLVLQCYNVVLITYLIEPGKPDVELGREVIFTFCVGTARNTSQRILGETRWDGRRITRTDRQVQKLTDAEMQKLRDDQKKRQEEKDKCFNDAVQRRREGHARVQRETPPLSSLLTGEDAMIAGAGGGITSGILIYKGATWGAVAGGGVSSAGISIGATILVRGMAQTIRAGLSHDEVNNQFNREYAACEAKHGRSSRPVKLLP